MIYSKETYNEDPIFYCTHCLSLNIKSIVKDNSLYVCGECGNIHQEETSVYNWEKLYQAQYKKNFLTNKSIEVLSSD